jgi:protocatechuate 3,4-dioxygenase beta subunit
MEGTEAIQVVRHRVRAGARDLRIALVADSDERLSIEGTLVDEAGAPVAERFVRAIGAHDRGEWKRGQTDAAGRFAIPGLEPGSYRLVLMRDYQKTYYVLSLGETEAGAVDVRLVARKGAGIRGTLSDETGPIVDAYVSADAADGDEDIHARTDATGAFSLTGIPPGARCTLTAQAKEEYVRAVVRDVPAGTADVRLVLRRGLEARGRLLGTDGAPLADVTLLIRHADEALRFTYVKTDAEGRFCAKGLAPGWHEVQVHLDYEFRPCGALEAGATNVELRVPAK